MSQEKTKASWADEIDELEETESKPVTYEKEFTNKGEEDDRVESSEDRPRRRERNNRDREPREQREQREPLPFPDSPPFTAFVGNLPYNVYRDEIQKFFEDRGCKVQNVRLLMNKENNKPKGFGYVTFEELTDLKNAVSLTGQTLLDRPLRIDVAEAKADDFVKPKREYNNSNRNYNNNRGGGSGGRYSSDRRDRERDRDSEGVARPKIELLPRSTSSSEDMSDVYKAKENPFGSARPRDENSALKQIEERRSKEDISPIEEREKPTTSASSTSSRGDRPPRRDNNRNDRNDRNDRPPRSDRGAPRGGGNRKYDDKKRDSRSNKEDKPRVPRPVEVVSVPKTQMSRNMFEGLEEE